MSHAPRLSEEEQADLVAYLDGELPDDLARAMESRLSLDPVARAEAESLRRTWDLLDFLPRPDPSPSFTSKTISRLGPLLPGANGAPPKPGRSPRWKRTAWVVGWAAALLLLGQLGYQGGKRLAAHEPGDAELTRELRLIENKRYYDLVDDVAFLEKLDQPDLFGEER
jgi:anti-sigma factor RsiW